MSRVPERHHDASGATPSCHGDPPLPARLEPWRTSLAADHGRCHTLLARYGSPVHLHSVDPFLRNVESLAAVGGACDLDLRVFFARKANKALAYVRAARAADIGVDVASQEELEQSLELGVPPARMVLSAAVKPDPVLRLASRTGTTVVLDHLDEVRRLRSIASAEGVRVPVAIRLHGFDSPEPGAESRFGFHVDDLDELLMVLARDAEEDGLDVRGLHFHLDGYDGPARVRALDQSMAIASTLRSAGFAIEFIDMGGGFPVSYLRNDSAWTTFLDQLDRALLLERPPITWRNEGFGRRLHGPQLVGEPAVYPHYQSPTGARWLESILIAPRPSDPKSTIRDGLIRQNLRLHAEPGRALLQGCGATLVRVEHCKPLRDGLVLVGLAMNGSNCRTRKSELLVDPILIPSGDAPRGPAVSGVLAGAYCTESDTIMSRILQFPRGVARGDAVLIPDTAGYYMHFVESRSHQFPLPLNLVLDADGGTRIDDIDLTS